jgi:DNA-binding NarL/FixJ family response regulator
MSGQDGTVAVVIVAGIRLYREGLAEVLSRQSRLRIVGVAGDHESGLAVTSETRPHVVLIDMGMPDAWLMVRQLARTLPDSRVVAMALMETENDVIGCAEAGVSAYVSREGSVADLVAAIESSRRGELLCSPRVAGSLFRRISILAGDRQGSANGPGLTRREEEILRLIDRGCSNKEIATHLGIEVATTKNHVHSILEKMRVHRRSEAAARFRRSLRF